MPKIFSNSNRASNFRANFIMDDNFFINLDDRSQQWLNSLMLDDCKELQIWLRNRIRCLKRMPFIKRKIEELNLSTRAYNALKIEGLNTVEDIVKYGRENIWKIRHIGSKTVEEIEKIVYVGN